MTNLSPIVLFVYNRFDHTKQTIEALQKNVLADESELYIYSDAAKNEDMRESVAEVREYIVRIDGFKKVTVIKREKNWGLADSIIDGVTKIVNEYGKVIVLEDDLIASTYFLKFMNDALNTYENSEEIASISGYMFPIDFPKDEFYFLPMIGSWGWATWENSWKLFEKDGKKLLQAIQMQGKLQAFDLDNTYPYAKMLKNQIKGKNNSWAIRWYASLFINNKLSIWPSYTLVENIGFDGSGTHCSVDYYNEKNLFPDKPILINKKEAIISTVAYVMIKEYLTSKGFSRFSIRKIMIKLISLFIK